MLLDIPRESGNYAGPPAVSLVSLSQYPIYKQGKVTIMMNN